MRLRDLLNPPAQTILDDRGREITIQPQAVQQAEAMEDEPPPIVGPPTPPRPWRDRLLLALSVLLLLAGLYGILLVGWRISRRLGGTLGISPATMAMLMIGVLVVIVLIDSRRSGLRTSREEIRLRSARLITSDRCGACTYTLESLSPEADGCTPCPECGAAWHVDAWKAQSPEFRQPEPKPLEHPHRKVAISDARGRRVLLYRPLRTPTEVWRLRGMSLAWLALACATFAAVSPLAARLFGTDPILARVIFWLLCGGAGLLTLLRLVRAPKVVRLHAAQKALAEHQCPACGTTLDASPSLIDHATLCTGCGGAWKLDSTLKLV